MSTEKTGDIEAHSKRHKLNINLMALLVNGRRDQNPRNYNRDKPLDEEKIAELLSQGADPLRVVPDIVRHLPHISPMEFAFRKIFEFPRSNDSYDDVEAYSEQLSEYAGPTLAMLKKVNAPLPPTLVAMAKKKVPLDGDNFTSNQIFSPLKEIHNAVARHELMMLSKKHEKLAFADDKQNGDADTHKKKVMGPSQRNMSERSSVRGKVVELLRLVWDDQNAWNKIFSDKELWRTPEDAQSFARASMKQHAATGRPALNLPAELFRALSAPDADTHLGRYLKTGSGDRGRNG